MSAEVALIIPVWNQAALLRRLLETISRQTLAPAEVLVIDNGSTDNAPEIARAWGARVIAMSHNAGFAAAVNCGIAASTSAWVALVNTDVELEPQWLEYLTRAAREGDAWFAVGKILMVSDPTSIDGTFDLVALSGCSWRAGNGWKDTAQFSEQREIAMTSATATLYRRELFALVGNFAEIYNSYLEDVDLSLRCASAGIKGVYVPSAVCHHRGSASIGAWSDRAVFLLARNQALLVKRLFPVSRPLTWSFRIFVGQWLWGCLAARHGRLQAWLRGRVDARRTVVDPVPLDWQRLTTALAASEREIDQMQRSSQWDFYWRLYFLITGSASK